MSICKSCQNYEAKCLEWEEKVSTCPVFITLDMKVKKDLEALSGSTCDCTSCQLGRKRVSELSKRRRMLRVI